jgi:hypothetical protein
MLRPSSSIQLNPDGLATEDGSLGVAVMGCVGGMYFSHGFSVDEGGWAVAEMRTRILEMKVG